MTNSDPNTTLHKLSQDLEAFVLDYRRLMLQDYEPYELTVTMMLVIAAVAQGATTLTVLSRQVHMLPPQAVLALNKLEKRGFIERSIEARDKRKVILGLTEAGRAMIKHVQTLREQRLRSFHEALGEAELKRFSRWFIKLREEMK